MDHNPTPDRVPSGDDGENAFDDPGGNYPDAGERGDSIPDLAGADAAAPTDPDAVDPAAGAPRDGDAAAVPGDRVSDRVPPDDDAGDRPAPEPGSPAPGHGGDHHGQDQGRTTVTVGEAQQATGGADEQDLPAMSQNNAGADEKLAGIIEQTRGDLPDCTAEEVTALLRERASQAGLDLDEDTAAQLADDIVADR